MLADINHVANDSFVFELLYNTRYLQQNVRAQVDCLNAVLSIQLNV